MANKFFHSVYLKKDNCIGCLTCLHRCPTQAIRISKGKARIIPEFCIDCGDCVQRCPHHAKRVRRNDLGILDKYEYTVALPDPALYSQFNNLTDVNIILTALCRLGFDDVFEVSIAAELISAKTRNYIADHPEQWPIISSACPTIERLIRVRFPNLINHLLPFLPPMEVAAKMARKKAVNDTGLPEEKIGIIFISPCASKISFINAPIGVEKSTIDAALAIKDLYASLLPLMKIPKDELKSLSHSGKIGIGWAISGGESAGLFTDHYLAADGIENVIRVLEDLEDEKFPENLRFIELNSCSGGCVGGVLNIENPYIATTKVKQIEQYTPITRPPGSEHFYVNSKELNWTGAVSYEPVYQLGSNMMESMINLSAVEAMLKELPGINCGSCGAPTCRALAEDIVRGKRGAKKEDCIHLLRDYYDELKKQQFDGGQQ